MSIQARDKRKVNVMIVASGLGLGGAEIVMRDLALTLDRDRFNVSVCCLKELGVVGQALARDGVDISVLATRREGKVDYLTSLQLRRVLHDKGIDIVHTHTTHGLVDAALCRLTMPRLRVVHTFHFGNYPHVPDRIRWMERIFSRGADRLIAVGDVQREQIKAVYRLDDASIRTVRNGVTFVPAEDNTAFLAQLAAKDRLIVGTIATLIEQKGLPDLLSVARRVKDAGLKALFVLVGEGRLRPALEARRQELDLEDDVVLTGWVHNAASVSLPAFDVFFQPSLWEAMSIAVLEAMAAGKPVVATRVGENPAVIDNGVDGVLVDPRDVERMAAAIVQLAGDESLRRRLGAAAIEKVRSRFTVEHMTKAYEREYLDIIGAQA